MCVCVRESLSAFASVCADAAAAANAIAFVVVVASIAAAAAVVAAPIACVRLRERAETPWD